MNNPNDCIFCKIARKEIPSYIIYEDEDFLAFLDILPIKKYHTLLIPKKHFQNFNNMDDELLKKSIGILKLIMQKIQNAYNINDFNVTTNIGKKSGQEVYHMHWHIIPHEIQRTSHKLDKRLKLDSGLMEEITQTLKIH